MVYESFQDDPRKCTAARLRKFNLARRIPSLKQIQPSDIVLLPNSTRLITKADRNSIERHGLVALDCSWNKSDEVFNRNIPGDHRRLPRLLAGNPTNYAVPGKLSTVEAFAAALYITGFTPEARRLLTLFSWGETFLTLNEEPLDAYSKAQPEDLAQVESSFF